MQWTWTWANSGRWWGTGRPGVLQSMGSQRVGHDWVTEQQQQKHEYSRFSTYKPSSCELSRMRTCIPSTSGVSEIAACLPSLFLTILQLYYLPPPLLLPVSNSSCLFIWCQPLDANCYTVLLYFLRYCKIKNVFFIYYLCEKYFIYSTVISAAAAKSLQLYPTLCDPIDGSPPGSSIPGILQARTLEWVAISFSNAWKWKVKMKSLSHVWPLATPWTAAHQAPPSMGVSRQEYRSGVPLPSPTIISSRVLNSQLC